MRKEYVEPAVECIRLVTMESVMQGETGEGESSNIGRT